MTSAELLNDAFGRIRENVSSVMDGLSAEQLAYRVDADANPVSWLVWHLTRLQDDHVAAAFGRRQVWEGGGWAAKLGLTEGTMDIGYGHTSLQVAAVGRAVAAFPEQLVAYHQAVYEQTVKSVSGIIDADLDRVVDRSWTPPVTLGVRLISVIDDDAQHIGQAAFVRGVVLRRLAVLSAPWLGVAVAEEQGRAFATDVRSWWQVRDPHLLYQSVDARARRLGRGQGSRRLGDARRTVQLVESPQRTLG